MSEIGWSPYIFRNKTLYESLLDSRPKVSEIRKSWSKLYVLIAKSWRSGKREPRVKEYTLAETESDAINLELFPQNGSIVLLKKVRIGESSALNTYKFQNNMKIEFYSLHLGGDEGLKPLNLIQTSQIIVGIGKPNRPQIFFMLILRDLHTTQIFESQPGKMLQVWSD